MNINQVESLPLCFHPTSSSPTSTTPPPIPIGRLHFPDYNPSSSSDPTGDTAWMKRAWLFIGENQRLQGEVKRLPRAVAVLRRRGVGGVGGGGGGGGEEEEEGGERPEELEVVEVVKYKVVFSSRPEPVGSEGVVAA
ncbi:Ctf8-domain-containing protein [Chaetomium sp. MPI-CAGE-AT-0009]|nr:Ctf8-domain-containing protein [Chaetomium sp. MPI-CAGE-AT-0009]